MSIKKNDGNVCIKTETTSKEERIKNLENLENNIKQIISKNYSGADVKIAYLTDSSFYLKKDDYK